MTAFFMAWMMFFYIPCPVTKWDEKKNVATTTDGKKISIPLHLYILLNKPEKENETDIEISFRGRFRKMNEKKQHNHSI